MAERDNDHLAKLLNAMSDGDQAGHEEVPAEEPVEHIEHIQPAAPAPQPVAPGQQAPQPAHPTAATPAATPAAPSRPTAPAIPARAATPQAAVAKARPAAPRSAQPVQAAAAAVRRPTRHIRTQSVFQTVWFKQTTIPIFLTMASISFALSALGLIGGKESSFAGFGRLWFVIPAVLIGLVLTGFGVMTMLQVKHELDRKAAAAGPAAPTA